MSNESANTDPTASTNTIDDKIAYHDEMEYLAMQAGDFTKADHHRKMKEICNAMKEKQQQERQS